MSWRSLRWKQREVLFVWVPNIKQFALNPIPKIKEQNFVKRLCWFGQRRIQLPMKTRTIHSISLLIEDAKPFEKTLHSVGRDFRKIEEVLPHKSICCLVEYFYKRRSEKKAKSAFSTRASRKRKEAENADGIENDLDLICRKAKNVKFS
ncbi:hypothetical protein WA026_023027 [Henosepilachna vigintioctopunctata]|uniref:Uncharacterized protein n=1 Tax=Henosepilachna vigintioctopunctata TaxID=420089 RepID=A0AAW1VJG1_9CUCU